MKERFDFDDPYKILAVKLATDFEQYDLDRLLTDDLYVRQLIIDELRHLDYHGLFLDTILTKLYADKEWLPFRRSIDTTGKVLFEHLDLEKLRFYLKAITAF